MSAADYPVTEVTLNPDMPPETPILVETPAPAMETTETDAAVAAQVGLPAAAAKFVDGLAPEPVTDPVTAEAKPAIPDDATLEGATDQGLVMLMAAHLDNPKAESRDNAIELLKAARDAVVKDAEAVVAEAEHLVEEAVHVVEAAVEGVENTVGKVWNHHHQAWVTPDAPAGWSRHHGLTDAGVRRRRDR